MVNRGQRATGAPDGRSARWTEHRRARREELVDAALDAVRRTGPALAVDDVARSAGVSKTVIYRYFTDKDELVEAVLDRIFRQILLPRLLGELELGGSDESARLRAAGRPTEPASIWAYGLVGMVQLAAHWWSVDRTLSGADLVEQLTALANSGLVALLREEVQGT